MISGLSRWIRGLAVRQRIEAATLLPIVALIGVLWFAPPDGVERAQLLQFFGRFHPLSVHLPIALLMLVPLLELAGRSRYFPSLRSSVDFVLGVATLGAIAAAWLGWCLAWSEGASGPLVTQHSWSGVFVAAAAWVSWVVCGRRTRPEGRWLCFGVLTATIALVAFTGHRGGQLSQGENYLTEYMPVQLASMIGVDAADDSAATSGNGRPRCAIAPPIVAQPSRPQGRIAACVHSARDTNRSRGLRVPAFRGRLRIRPSRRGRSGRT